MGNLVYGRKRKRENIAQMGNRKKQKAIQKNVKNETLSVEAVIYDIGYLPRELCLMIANYRGGNFFFKGIMKVVTTQLYYICDCIFYQEKSYVLFSNGAIRKNFFIAIFNKNWEKIDTVTIKGEICTDQFYSSLRLLIINKKFKIFHLNKNVTT